MEGERFAEIKLYANDIKSVVFTVPEDLDSIYMYSLTYEAKGMAETIRVVH